MEVSYDEKKKILPKPLHKKVKNGRKKLRLDLEQTASLLANKKKDNGKANNNNTIDNSPVPLEEDYPREEEPPPTKFFGVRNYLHNFYETVSIKNPQLYEDIPADEPASGHPFKDSRYYHLCCRVGFGIAFVLVFVGLVLMLVGFITPLHSTIAAKNAEFLIIDRSATAFNEHMRICRWIGIYIFLTGFFIFMVVVLAAIGFSLYVQKNEDDEESTFGDNTNFCLTLEAEDGNYQKCIEMPVAVELSAVQPKRGEDDVVVAKGELVAPQPMAVLQIKAEK